jgi:hypothetical protein
MPMMHTGRFGKKSVNRLFLSLFGSTARPFASTPWMWKTEVEGIGPATATTVVAAIPNGRTFDNGRQFASGSKPILLGRVHEVKVNHKK